MASSKRSARKATRGSRRGRAASQPPPAPERASGADGGRAPLLVCVGLVVLAAAIFHPVVGHEFVLLDDPAYYTKNPQLDGRLGLDDLRSAFAETYYANWTPLTSLSIALGDALHGPAPAPVLLTNLALHALAGVLLFLALLRMTKDLGASAFVAGVFVAHPLQVEPVAWASQRKDVMMGVFWMAALWAHARYAERPALRRYLLAVACVALALLSKPVAVTLPFALLLLDFWPLRRFGPGSERSELRRAVLEKLPLLGLVAAVSVVTLVAQSGVGATRALPIPLADRLANALVSYAAYLRDSVWPGGLAVFYPHARAGLGAGLVAGSAALLVALTLLCVGSAARRPALCVGWLWFLGTLVPMIGLVQVGTQARADRYMYLPLVGLSLAVAFGAREPIRRLGAAGAALGLAVVAVLAFLSHAQVAWWKDSRTLFARAIEVTRDNYAAYELLGSAERAAGDLAGAEQHLRESLRLQPDGVGARVALAALLIDQGRTSEARAELEGAREAGADSADLYAALGLAAEREGRDADAVASYRLALERDPDHREAGNNLAWILATTRAPGLRDPDGAIRLAERVARRSAGDAFVLDTLAAAYAAAGRYGDAERAQARAIEALSPEADQKLRADFRERLGRYRAGQQPDPGAGS